MDPVIPASVNLIPNREMLPNPNAPWLLSKEVFQRVQSASSIGSYKKCEITNKDPEWEFVFRYFEMDKPDNRHIGRVYCIHNPESTRSFETLIPVQETESQQPVFAPKWSQEAESNLRKRANNRWKGMRDPFSPVVIQTLDQRNDTYHNVSVLPLWQGSTAFKCDSICKTGFTSFGKQDMILGAAGPGLNTDIGFFGSGIYFTNSLRYAADIYSDGNVLLAWVSMREPYPVIANCKHPDKPDDMKKLAGNSHYQNYNAHHIPVISINPANKNCKVYYPCTVDQEPVFDEFVVFQNTQTLPRYWAELEVTLAKSPILSIDTIGTLLNIILELLENVEVQQNPELSRLLGIKANALFTINETTPLDPENLAFYQKITRLMDSAGQVRLAVAKQLTISQISPSPLSLRYELAALQDPMLPTISEIIPIKNSTIAIGAESWRKYFGDVGVEPPLPIHIDTILNTPCPFWANRRIGDTHLLVLIPATVNGTRYTLNLLQELIQNPKEGNKTKFREYSAFVQNEFGDQSTLAHWALMPWDVIPESRDKTYEEQKLLIEKFAQNTGLSYEIPTGLQAATCILLEHVQKGIKHYSNAPLTFTRTLQAVNRNQPFLCVGGFTADGIGLSGFWSDYPYLGMSAVLRLD